MVLRVRLLSPGLFHRAVRHVTGRPRLLDGATECFNGLATMNWDCKFATMVRRKKQRFKNYVASVLMTHFFMKAKITESTDSRYRLRNRIQWYEKSDFAAPPHSKIKSKDSDSPKINLL